MPQVQRGKSLLQILDYLDGGAWRHAEGISTTSLANFPCWIQNSMPFRLFRRNNCCLSGGGMIPGRRALRGASLAGLFHVTGAFCDLSNVPGADQVNGDDSRWFDILNRWQQRRHWKSGWSQGASSQDRFILFCIYDWNLIICPDRCCLIGVGSYCWELEYGRTLKGTKVSQQTAQHVGLGRSNCLNPKNTIRDGGSTAL